MKRLVIVRHGLTKWTTRFTGWTDIDLAPEGIELTKKYALRIKKQGYRFDVGYTSVLKRGIKTLEIVLETIGQNVPIIKDWHLNERYYGALQGLDKRETAKKYGEEKVKSWRRSYDILPPPVNRADIGHPVNDPKYKDINPDLLPSAESLKTTYERVIPYFKQKIEPDVKKGRGVILSGHSNSIRAIVKYLDNISDSRISDVNIPYCIPLIYEFDDLMTTNKHFYLADENELNKAILSIKNQAKPLDRISLT